MAAISQTIQKQSLLAQKLEALGVGVLYLFGSRVRGVAREKSDYDLGVVFRCLETADVDLELYNELYDVLNEIFPDMIDGPRLDISFLQNANAALQMSAIRYGTVFYESDPVFRANYEESVLKKYDDYRFLQRQYEEATFSAFRKPRSIIHV